MQDAEPSSEETPSEVLTPGTMVGEYRIEGRIGEGGFGAVYRAHHPLIAKDAAVKVLSAGYAARPEHVSRFLAEARAANQIGHPNIVDIFSFGRLEDGRHYFVMELVDGVSLREWAREPVSLPQALPILERIARALQAAHDHGIVHRDLKPANVLLAWQDDELDLKLIDFGIAKLVDQDPGHRTRTGAFLGTPDYMSPEQCRSQAIDHRSDIYAFGVLAYRLITGRKLFEGDSAMDVMVCHMSEAPPRASEVRPGLPPAFDDALAALLAKAPDDRPSSITEAYRRLADAAVGQSAPGQTAEGQAAEGSATTRRSGFYWLAAGAVMLAGLGLYTLIKPTTQPPVDAQPEEPEPPAPTTPPAPRPAPSTSSTPVPPPSPAPVVVPAPVRPAPVVAPPSPPPPPQGGSRDDLEF